MDILSSFPGSLAELTLTAKPGGLSVRNYIDVYVRGICVYVVWYLRVCMYVCCVVYVLFHLLMVTAQNIHGTINAL